MANQQWVGRALVQQDAGRGPLLPHEQIPRLAGKEDAERFELVDVDALRIRSEGRQDVAAKQTAGRGEGPLRFGEGLYSPPHRRSLRPWLPTAALQPFAGHVQKRWFVHTPGRVQARDLEGDSGPFGSHFSGPGPWPSLLFGPLSPLEKTLFWASVRWLLLTWVTPG